MTRFYEHENFNIHRAAHTLAAHATDAYEGARQTVRRFIDAPSEKDLIFVRGTTEGINLVAQSWGRRNVGAGDEIVITWLEHHANIVPWQQLCAEKEARLLVAPVEDTGQVLLEECEKLLGPKTRLVSMTQVSNALGTITPGRQMVDLAHRHRAKVLIDGAQAVSNQRTDVQMLACDFYVFSGQKVFAPTGVGAVFGRAHLLDAIAAVAVRCKHDSACRLRENGVQPGGSEVRSGYWTHSRCRWSGRSTRLVDARGARAD